MTRKAWLLATIASSFVAAGAAQAAEETAPVMGLEEIVVTAQKREENLQSVPIAITAITATQLARNSINTTMDLSFATPSLNFSQTAVFAQPYIRGIGTDSYAPGNEASVATYVDGVYIANMNASTFNLANVERIEVLKGPQGTLYGRNSTGGLINVITRTPTQDFMFRGNVSYANFNTVEGQAYVGGGLGPNVAADLAVSIKRQGRGFYYDYGTRERVSVEDGAYIRGKIVADLTQNVRLTVSGDYSDSRNTLANTRQPAETTVPALAVGTYSTQPGAYFNSRSDQGNVWDGGLSANLSADFDAFRLVSITAYRHTDASQYLDGDDSSRPLSDIVSTQLYKQFSQEVQILSPPSERFNWILGAYYLDADAGWNPINALANNVVVNSAFLFSASKSVAGFGQATLSITDKSNLTVGARYTHDKKDYRRSSAPGQDVERSWNKPTWRVSYDYKLTPSVMAYASYNRGYKSGVYNTVFGPPVAVNPEIVDSVEAGFKGDLFSRRLRANLSTFYSKFKDIQVRAQAPGNTATTLANAAAAEIYGIDGDFYWVLSKDLQLQFGVSWIHGRYTDFPRAEIYVPLATGGNRLTIADVSGRPLPRTPEFSGNIGFAYDHRFDDDSRIYASTNLFITDDIPWEPSGRVITKSYAVLNGTLGYAFPGDHYSIEVFSRNLTDTRYANYVVPSANTDRTSYASPRTFGVRLSARY